MASNMASGGEESGGCYPEEATEAEAWCLPKTRSRPPIGFQRRIELQGLAAHLVSRILEKTETHERHLLFSMIHDLVDDR
jgi:hypothetical protein